MIRILSILIVLILSSSANAQEVTAIETPVTSEASTNPIPVNTEEQPTDEKAQERKEQSILSVYMGKMAYRNYLREKKLNPSDEEIVQKINQIKEDPEAIMQELAATEKAPEKITVDPVLMHANKLHRLKPKRLGNHSLGVDPSIF